MIEEFEDKILPNLIGRKWVVNQVNILKLFYRTCERIVKLERAAEITGSQFMYDQSQKTFGMTVRNFTKIFGGDPGEYSEMPPLTFFSNGARFALKQRSIGLFRQCYQELSTGQSERVVDAIQTGITELGDNKSIPIDLLAAFVWFRNTGLKEAWAEVTGKDAT